MNKENLICPRWVRIYPEAQEKIHKEWILCGSGVSPTKEYAAFVDNWDYRESCMRASRFQTWKTRIIRFLLWMVEKIYTF